MRFDWSAMSAHSRSKSGIASLAYVAGTYVIKAKQKLEHDPEKWKPVFRKDHAQSKS
jgi:hypothetical protein